MLNNQQPTLPGGGGVGGGMCVWREGGVVNSLSKIVALETLCKYGNC